MMKFDFIQQVPDLHGVGVLRIRKDLAKGVDEPAALGFPHRGILFKGWKNGDHVGIHCLGQSPDTVIGNIVNL